ncbi:MAG: DUF3054 domain-containing protein [Anaerolineales bacterium]
MVESKRISALWILVAGDVLVLLLVTIFGFATHGELGTAGLRMLTTFVPLVVAWGLVAPHLGVFDLEKSSQPAQLWRPFWAMVLAGPWAAWLRGVMLNEPILPIFVVVLGGICALALLLWRTLYWAFYARRA